MVVLTGWSVDSWALWPGRGPGPICSPPGLEQNDPVQHRGPRGPVLGGHQGRPSIFSWLSWSPGSCLPPVMACLRPQGQCPSSCGPAPFKPLGTRRGHLKGCLGNPTGCSWAAGPRGWEGLEGAHSWDVSGWVCLWRLPESSSTCPRNVAGCTSPPPHPGAVSALGKLRGGREHPLAREEFCLSAKPSQRQAGPICPCG